MTMRLHADAVAGDVAAGLRHCAINSHWAVNSHFAVNRHCGVKRNCIGRLRFGVDADRRGG